MSHKKFMTESAAHKKSLIKKSLSYSFLYQFTDNLCIANFFQATEKVLWVSKKFKKP